MTDAARQEVDRRLATVARLWLDLEALPARLGHSAAYRACETAIRAESDAVNALVNDEPGQGARRWIR